MDDKKYSLTDFIKFNAPLLTAFGVFTALAVYFKNSGLPEAVVFSPLFLSLLIIFELYRNLITEKRSASTTLKLFEGGLLLVLFSIFVHTLSASNFGRSMFGMGLGVSVFAILYPRIKKHLDNRFKTHKKTLAILYFVAFSLWWYILMDYIRILNFEPFFKDIVTGFLAGIFAPSCLLIYYLFEKKDSV